MEISFPADLERALLKQADRRGTTPERLVVESLRATLVPSGTAEQTEQATSGPEMLIDFLGSHVGALHSSEHVPGGAHLSEEVGERFTRGMAEKHRRGES